MKRVLEFDGDSVRDRMFYRRAVEAYVLGASVAPPGERGITQIRTNARLLKALKTLAGRDEDADAVVAAAKNPETVRVVSRILLPEGGRIVLEQADLSVLKSYVERAGWQPHDADDVADLYDWLDSRPEHREEAVTM